MHVAFLTVDPIAEDASAPIRIPRHWKLHSVAGNIRTGLLVTLVTEEVDQDGNPPALGTRNLLEVVRNYVKEYPFTGLADAPLEIQEALGIVQFTKALNASRKTP